MSTASEERPTRERDVEDALELFVSQGYDKTSLREISEQLGFTKAALYYHFESKDEILRELTTRMLDKLQSVLARVAPDMSDAQRRRVLIEGWIDLLLQQRKAVHMMMQAHSHLHSNEALTDVHERFHETMQSMMAGLAGPKPALLSTVRATMAVGGLLDVVVQSDLSATSAKLKSAMLEVVSQILDLR
jgi:AcrR family transcriptional regulator